MTAIESSSRAEQLTLAQKYAKAYRTVIETSDKPLLISEATPLAAQEAGVGPIEVAYGVLYGDSNGIFSVDWNDFTIHKA